MVSLSSITRNMWNLAQRLQVLVYSATLYGMREKALPAIKLPDDLQPGERFEQLAKMLLAVPKREIDVLLAEYEIAKKQRQELKKKAKERKVSK